MAAVAERHREHEGVRVGDDRQRHGPCRVGDVPQPHGAVVAGAGQDLAVGAERDELDLVGESGRRPRRDPRPPERGQSRAAPPQLEAPGAVPGGDQVPAGGDGHGVDVLAGDGAGNGGLGGHGAGAGGPHLEAGPAGRERPVSRAERDAVQRAAGEQVRHRQVPGPGIAVGVAGEQQARAAPGQRRHRLGVGDHRERCAGRGVPQPDLAVAAAPGQHLPVRAERDRHDPAGGPGQMPGRGRLGRIAGVPQPDIVVIAPSGQLVATGAERDRVDGSGGSGQRLGRGPWPGRVRHIPQPDGLVGTARGQQPSVRAEGHRLHVPGRPGQRAPLGDGVPGVADIPQPHRLIRAPGGQQPPVRAECQRIDRAARPGQRRAEQDRLARVGDPPQPHLLVGAGGGEHLPVRAERGRVQRVPGTQCRHRAERRGVAGPGDIPQPQRAIGGSHGKQRAAGGQRDGLYVAVGVEHARRRWHARRLQQAGQRARRRRDAIGGQRQLRGQRWVLRPDLAGLDGHGPRLGLVLGGGCDLPLMERVYGQPHGQQDQDGEGGHQLPQPPGAAPLGRLLRPLLGDAGVHEVPAALGQRGTVGLADRPVPG